MTNFALPMYIMYISKRYEDVVHYVHQPFRLLKIQSCQQNDTDYRRMERETESETTTTSGVNKLQKKNRLRKNKIKLEWVLAFANRPHFLSEFMNTSEKHAVFASALFTHFMLILFKNPEMRKTCGFFFLMIF